MSNIVLYPGSGILEFNTGVAGQSVLDNSLTGASRFSFNSGEINLTNYATGNLNRFTIDGSQGRLFLIDDQLSGSLFSVNTIAGLPVVEAFSDNTITLGQYGKYDLIVTGNSVGIGGLPNTGTQKLYVSGNLHVSGNIYLSGNAVMTGSNASFVTTGQTGVFALSSQVVYTTGAQTISGVKTFADSGVFSLSGIQSFTLPSNPLSIVGSGNTYLQLNIQNRATGDNASTDLIITANDGTDSTYYLDLGLNNVGYNQSAYGNVSGHDGYLYINGGNLTVGTQTVGTVVEIHAGGTTDANQVAEFNSTGMWLKGVAKISGNLYNSYQTIVTGAPNIITLDFTTGEYFINITGAATQPYTITGINIPSAPYSASTSVFLYNTGVCSGLLTFPNTWIFLGSKPSGLITGKSSLLSLKSYGTTVAAGYSIQY